MAIEPELIIVLAAPPARTATITLLLGKQLLLLPLRNVQRVLPLEPTQEQKRRIEEIARKIKCPKNFVCYKSHFKNLCNAKLIAGGTLLECLEEKQHRSCRLAVPYADTAFCKCPLRFYIAEKLHI